MEGGYANTLNHNETISLFDSIVNSHRSVAYVHCTVYVDVYRARFSYSTKA